MPYTTFDKISEERWFCKLIRHFENIRYFFVYSRFRQNIPKMIQS